MSQSLVVAKDLIEQFPDDYTTSNRECPKCDGRLYEYSNIYGFQCENVVYRHGQIWEQSPCDNIFTSG